MATKKRAMRKATKKSTPLTKERVLAMTPAAMVKEYARRAKTPKQLATLKQLQDVLENGPESMVLNMADERWVAPDALAQLISDWEEKLLAEGHSQYTMVIEDGVGSNRTTIALWSDEETNKELGIYITRGLSHGRLRDASEYQWIFFASHLETFAARLRMEASKRKLDLQVSIDLVKNAIAALDEGPGIPEVKS